MMSRSHLDESVGGSLYVVGHGPTDASTSLDLAIPLRQVWDANGYYRDLGISPDATRREIREAYQRLNGQESPRLTYIVKQLLDPEVRARYDATPLGSVFLDYEVETMLRLARVQQTAMLRAQGRAEEAEEIEALDFGESLDTLIRRDKDEPAQPDQTVWSWSYYLKGTQPPLMGRERLRRWQELLVSALGRTGLRLRLAVGFSGGMGPPWEVTWIGSQVVVFLRDDERPTEALARQAASRVVQHRQPTTPRGPEHGDFFMSANFRKGAEAAKEAVKSAGNFAKTNFFGLGDGETAILRFLTDADDWITVDQHQMVPTKGKPADYPKDARWPEKMGCVCRKDPAFDFGECYVCENLVDGKKVKKPGARQWALACLREEVMEGGKVVGYRDKTREVVIPEKDGQPEKKVTEKAIVVVNMAYKNFFSILEGFAGRYGTILDRDYWIKRSGDDTSTTYQVVPIDPIQTQDGIFDLREPQFMARYEHNLDLGEIISERASDEFYAKFFDPRFTVEDGKIIKAGDASAPAPEAPESDVDPDRMEALASRVKGYGGAAASESPKADESPKEPAAAGGMRDFG